MVEARPKHFHRLTEFHRLDIVAQCHRRPVDQRPGRAIGT
jgi:hypothetical protein